MEYEDLYTKMSLLALQYTEDQTIIKRLKGELKSSQEKLRKEKMKEPDFVARLELTKKHIEQFRNENIMLEEMLDSRTKDLKSFEEKCKILEADKVEMRKDYIALSKKMNGMRQATPDENKKQTEDKEIDKESDHLADKSIEIINEVEKKLQTTT